MNSPQLSTTPNQRAQRAVNSVNPFDDIGACGFCHLSSSASRQVIQNFCGVEVDPRAFFELWNGLALDEYMRDGGKYRQRSFDTFLIQEPDGPLVRTEPRPHYQAEDVNKLNGGIDRWYEPASDEFIARPEFQALMYTARYAFERISPIRRWRCETHQFRISTSEDEKGQPTPEGKHRDGVDFGFILLGRRVNVRGGVTTIEDDAGLLLTELTMRHPFEWVLFDDERIRHGVSAITPIDPSKPAYRDTLVVTFKALD